MLTLSFDVCIQKHHWQLLSVRLWSYRYRPLPWGEWDVLVRPHQGSKFKFELGSTCATRCKFLGAQLKILGAQLTMLGASISKEEVPLYMSSSVCYFYFSPVIDKTQPICYAVIPLWFLILISLFDSTVVTKENLHLNKNQN